MEHNTRFSSVNIFVAATTGWVTQEAKSGGQIRTQDVPMYALWVSLLKERWRRQDWAETEAELSSQQRLQRPVGLQWPFRGILSWYDLLGLQLPASIRHWMQIIPGS